MSVARVKVRGATREAVEQSLADMGLVCRWAIEEFRDGMPMPLPVRMAIGRLDTAENRAALTTETAQQSPPKSSPGDCDG